MDAKGPVGVKVGYSQLVSYLQLAIINYSQLFIVSQLVIVGYNDLLLIIVSYLRLFTFSYCWLQLVS